MNKLGGINLSTVFRRQIETHSQDGINIKQEFLDQKLEKTEFHSSLFLVDRKYALNLDELI